MQNYIGKQIDRYRITERLGMGGMAVVYKAYDTRLERDVAFKLIRVDEIPPSQHERLIKRFEREAKAMARFSHPNIVPVHDYGEVNGTPYLVMEYIPGGTLKDRINRPIPYRQAIRWLAPIADALRYAHERNVLHRDVKPSNILFDSEDRPMLTDFGIAKVLETEEATLTGTGLGVGTPEYMAPEQWQGKTSEATDQYALGVVFYELITGRKPYSADTPAAIILMQATEPLAPPSGLVQGIPENVEKVLYKSLARNPEDRYESIGTLAEILRKLLANTEAEEQGSSRHATQPFQSIPSGNVESTSEGITYDILESTSVEEIPKPLTSNKNEKKGGYSWMGWAFFVSILLILITLVFDFRSISINRSTGDERESISLVTETEEPTVTPTKTATIMPTANPTEEYWNLSVLFDEIYQSGHNHKWTENDKWTLDQQKDLWSRIDEKVLNEVEKIVTDMNTNYRDDFSEAYIGYKPQEVIGNEGLEITLGMVLWGFGSIDDNGHLVGRTGESWDLIYQFPSIEDFKNQILITYDYDIAEAFPYESSDAVDVLEVVKSNFIAFWLTQ